MKDLGCWQHHPLDTPVLVSLRPGALTQAEQSGVGVWETRITRRPGAFSSGFVQVCCCLRLLLDSLIKETAPSYGKQERRGASVMGCWKVRAMVPAGSIFCGGKGADLVPMSSHASTVLLQRFGSCVLGFVTADPTHSSQAKVLVWPGVTPVLPWQVTTSSVLLCSEMSQMSPWVPCAR